MYQLYTLTYQIFLEGHVPYRMSVSIRENSKLVILMDYNYTYESVVNTYGLIVSLFINISIYSLDVLEDITC